MAWTEEQIELVKKLAATHSAGQIAAILGVTRNAVIGKLKRLKVKLSSGQRTNSSFAHKPSPSKALDSPVRPKSFSFKRDNYRSKSPEQPKAPTAPSAKIMALVSEPPEPISMDDINPYAELEKMARCIWKD